MPSSAPNPVPNLSSSSISLSFNASSPNKPSWAGLPAQLKRLTPRNLSSPVLKAQPTSYISSALLEYNNRINKFNQNNADSILGQALYQLFLNSGLELTNNAQSSPEPEKLLFLEKTIFNLNVATETTINNFQKTKDQLNAVREINPQAADKIEFAAAEKISNASDFETVNDILITVQVQCHSFLTNRKEEEEQKAKAEKERLKYKNEQHRTDTNKHVIIDTFKKGNAQKFKEWTDLLGKLIQEQQAREIAKNKPEEPNNSSRLIPVTA